MIFRRLLEFSSTLDTQTLRKDIRSHLPNALNQAPKVFEPYEQSLKRLDIKTWEYVKQKLLRVTLKDTVRGWAQFYEVLAEVRGYCYLLDSEYENVRFIPENHRARTPDIEATDSHGIACLLESKSIGFSRDELNYISENTRRLDRGQTLIVRDVIQGLPQQLKDKIVNAVRSAKNQLFEYLPRDVVIERIVYLTLHLDMHMLLDMQNYTQIVNFVRKLIREEVEVKIVIDELSSV